MSPTGKKILLIDGYNVINRTPELKFLLEGDLENARKKLALLISAWSRTHPAFECVIIFDGDPQYAGDREVRLSGIRCTFSRTSHGGDDEIIRYVKDHRGRKSDITVVSDDNNVGNNCRAHGASVQPSSYIMTGIPRHTGGGREASPDGKRLNKKTAAEITKELTKKFGL